MVIAYIDGKPAEKRTSDFNELMAWLFEQRQEAEFRTDDGKVLGRYVPESICPWDPSLTKEELDRRVRESGRSTLDEFWHRMGVK